MDYKNHLEYKHPTRGWSSEADPCPGNRADSICETEPDTEPEERIIYLSIYLCIYLYISFSLSLYLSLSLYIYIYIYHGQCFANVFRQLYQA